MASRRSAHDAKVFSIGFILQYFLVGGSFPAAIFLMIYPFYPSILSYINDIKFYVFLSGLLVFVYLVRTIWRAED